MIITLKEKVAILPPLLQILEVPAPDWEALPAVWHYHNGLSTATHRCYLTEQQHYIQSCNQVNQISDSYI